MKIFNSFLIILAVAILFLLPITQGIEDFRTDLRENEFFYETGGGVTTANVTLLKELYEDDTSEVAILSDDSDDIPVLVEYHTATRILDISGLAQSTNRTLTVSYDIDALEPSSGIATFLGVIGTFWLICVIAFAPAAIVAIFTNKV
jgi:hypothetical protein